MVEGRRERVAAERRVVEGKEIRKRERWKGNSTRRTIERSGGWKGKWTGRERGGRKREKANGEKGRGKRKGEAERRMGEAGGKEHLEFKFCRVRLFVY